MDIHLFQQLHREGAITDKSFEQIKDYHSKKLFSVHWEIKTLLYLGVLLLTGGLGILVYKNIDTIGHQAILVFIALLCGGSFFYCIKNKHPFSVQKVEAPNAYFDYVLLLGCLTFISFIAYLQFAYNVFGNRYGLATFFPMLVLFCSAYYFDHIGILSLAITNLGAWLGITVTPMQLLNSNDFDDAMLIFTGLLLGALLIALAFFSNNKNIKKHFEFTYTNFGMHVLFISSLAAMFHFEAIYLLWFLLLAGITYFFYRKAIQQKSFYFLLITTLYSYIGISYVVIRLLSAMNSLDMGAIYIGLLYFIASGIGLILFLIQTNKKLKAA
jgi:Predicted membrane protein (DUF2157)